MIKPGSKVVILPLPHGVKPYSLLVELFIRWLPKFDGKTVYEVKDIAESISGDTIVVLTQCIGVIDGSEIGIDIKYVREVETGGQCAIEELVEQAMKEAEKDSTPLEKEKILETA